jgi:hypothetical protein
MAQKDEDAVTANLVRMGHYLNEFGLSKHGEALISTSHVWQYANNPGTMEFDNESPESISAQSVVKRLGGAPKHAYYTFNKRTIPGVAQTEYNGHELVFTNEPLSQEKMSQWEIYPAYAPAPGAGYADLRAAAAQEPEATPPPQKPIDIPPKTPDTTAQGATTAPEPEKSKVEHFSVTASGRGFSQAIALLKKRGGKFNPATKTWAVPTGKVTADDASSFGLLQKAFPQKVRSKQDEDNFGNEDDPERFRVYR